MWKRLLARCDEDVRDTVACRYRGLFAEETGIALFVMLLLSYCLPAFLLWVKVIPFDFRFQTLVAMTAVYALKALYSAADLGFITPRSAVRSRPPLPNNSQTNLTALLGPR